MKLPSRTGLLWMSSHMEAKITARAEKVLDGINFEVKPGEQEGAVVLCKLPIPKKSN